MDRKVAAALLRSVHATLAILQVFGPSCEALVPSYTHLMKFSKSLKWNDARAACQQNGMDLAQIDPFNTEFLLQEQLKDSQNLYDYIWVGLYDVAQDKNSLGTEGYRWAGSCQSLGQQAGWVNWKPGEPMERYNNWCIRIDFASEFQWFPEQCSTVSHFLCESVKETPCNRFIGCDVDFQVSSLSKVPSQDPNSGTESGCKDACVAYVDREANVTCWAAKLTLNKKCQLYVGTSPLQCSAFLGATAAEPFLWIRTCYTITYNTTQLQGTSYDEYPAVNCSSSASDTVPPETTSATTESTTTKETTTTTTEQTTSATTTTTAEVTTDTTRTTEQAQTTSETMSTSTASSFPTTTAAATEAEVTTASSTVPVATATSAKQATTTSTEMTMSATPPTTADNSDGTTGSLAATTMSQDTTTAALNQTTAPTSTTRCSCTCSQQQTTAIVDVTKSQEAMQQLKEALTLDISTLSSTRRRKTSAPDERPSAKATGALGVILVVGAFGLIVVPDVRALYHAIRFGPYH